MAETVDVCICTYRRASLNQALASVAGQGLPAGVTLRVVIADNDETPSAEGLAREAAAGLGLDLTYVHAPARNISIARNACLDAARGDHIAMLDDDEAASPTWVANLLAASRSRGADVVFGPVQALYPSGAPAWVEEADLHSAGPVILPGGVIETGYAGNCLIRRGSLGAHRFDLALGRSGGEDTAFFNALHRDGRRLVFAPEALVFEEVPAARASLKWLTTRSFRSGQTHGRVLLQQGEARAGAAALALSKAAACGAMAAAQLPTGRWRPSVVRGALHLGVVAKMVGLADLKLY